MTVGPRTRRLAALCAAYDPAICRRTRLARQMRSNAWPPCAAPRAASCSSWPTPLRWGELTGLRVADINLTTRRLQVRRSITQVGGKLILGATKSRAGVRTVPIPTLIEPLLTQRIKGKATDAAITSPRGALLSRENWVRAVCWNEQRKSLGKPTLRIHDLRHTYASLSRFAGADLRLLQRTLGHASITVTAHIYAHLYDTELDSLADALDSLTTPASGNGSPPRNRNDGPPEAHQEQELSTETELD